MEPEGMEHRPHPLFAGIELAEPSAELDSRLLAAAGSFLVRRSRRRAAARFALLAAAAGLVMAVLLLRASPRSATGELEARGESPSLETLAEIRVDLDQIGEMADLIPPGRDAEREMIALRVRACLADLDRLELQVKSVSESSLLPENPRKVVNI
jgi:hypothetical protein